MGKKIKYMIASVMAIVMAVYFIPSTYGANFASLTISGSATATTGSSFTVNIDVTNSGSEKTMTMGGVVGVTDPSCVQFVGVEGVASGVDAEGEMVSFFKTSGVAGNFTIAKIKLKAGNNACTTTVTVSEGTLSSVSGQELDLPTVTKTITVAPAAPKSNIATLKSLTPNTGTLSPSFSSNTDTYSMEVESTVSKVTFTAAVTDTGKATVSGTTCNINSSPTACKIVVTAEDGTTKKTYTVNVTKKAAQTTPNNPSNPGNDTPTDPNPGNNDQPEDKPGTPVNTKSSDATLASITISDNDGKVYSLSPAFSKNNNTYTITIPSIVSTLHITAPTSDPNAVAEIPSVTGLKTGYNVVRIPVTAEDGTKIVYTINVNKEAAAGEAKPVAKSSDNYIKSLIVNDGVLQPSFDKNISSYNITIPNEKTSLDLQAILNNAGAKLNIVGNSDFQVCSKENLYCNTVTLEVTAQDGSLRVYTINVNRSETASNNKLDRLEVSDGKLSPSFDPDIYEYNVDVGSDINDLKVTAIPAFDTTRVEVFGNENLKEGNNVVIVKSTDENGFVQYYRINVKKAKAETKAKNKTFLGLPIGYWILIPGLLLLLIPIIILLILLLKKKDKEDENKTTTAIEFKPEINIGSRNNTDDDYVAEGAVLNQIEGNPHELTEKPQPQIAEAEVVEIPYDIYDDVVTKDELYDAIKEAKETNDPSKLKMLLDQEKLNREKERLQQLDKEKENEK